MFNKEHKEKFIALLDEQYDWPAAYKFKFIVPNDKLDELMALVGDAEVQTRPSKKGNYISLTATKELSSAEDVIDVYERVSSIEGIVSL